MSSFSDLVRFLIRQLLADHRESIYEYAADGGQGFTAGKAGSTQYQEEVAPELWVLMHTDTNNKLKVLRGLFNHLGLDPDDLILTLRQQSGKDETTSEEPNPYADLLKFAAQFESFEGTAVTEQDIAELRTEFRAAFREFEIEDWQSLVNGRGYPQLADPAAVKDLSVDEVLSAFMLVKVSDSMIPGTFRGAVNDGAIVRWLHRIAELTEAKKEEVGDQDTAAMWKKLLAIVESIPHGAWVSYGDLAKAIGSAAQPVGNYLARNRAPKAYRVLKSDGSVSEGFYWQGANDKRLPRELLEEEGIVFNSAGKAAPSQRWDIPPQYP